MGEYMRYVMRTLAVAIAATGLALPVSAGNLIYQPTIPAFGGNPNNFDYFIGLAQIQNQHQPEQSGGGGGGAPAINFPPITIDLGGVGGGGQAPSDTPAE